MAGQEEGRDPREKETVSWKRWLVLGDLGPRDRAIRQASSRVGGRSVASWGPDLTRNH